MSSCLYSIINKCNLYIYSNAKIRFFSVLTNIFVDFVPAVADFSAVADRRGESPLWLIFSVPPWRISNPPPTLRT